MKSSLFALLLITCLGTACNRTEAPSAPFMFRAYRYHAEAYRFQTRFVERTLHMEQPLDQQIHGMTEGVIRTVEDMERELLRKAGQADPRLTAPAGVVATEKLLDHTIASSILIGPDPARPSTAPLSAEALKAQIDMHLTIVAQLGPVPDTLLQALLPTGDLVDGSGTVNRWSTGTFYNVPLIHALDELNTIKVRLRQIELLALSNAHARETTAAAQNVAK